MNNQTGWYHFRCWRSSNKEVIGEALSIYEYQAYINAGWHILAFNGHRGNVCILIQDMTITRQNCLEYAIAFMEGKMIEIRVNIDRGTVETRPVKPPPYY